MKTSDEPITRRATVPSHRGGRRLAWAAVAMLVVAFLALLVLAGISALGVRRHLLDGRDALDRGKSDLIDGDAAAAESEFDSANEAFRAGQKGPDRSGSRSPVRSLSWGTRRTRSERWRMPA